MSPVLILEVLGVVTAVRLAPAAPERDCIPALRASVTLKERV